MYGSMQRFTERDTLPSEYENDRLKMHVGKRIIKSDIVLKFFVCLLYGVIPRRYRKSFSRIIPSLLIVLIQWFSVVMYIYMAIRVWRKEIKTSSCPKITPYCQKANHTSFCYYKISCGEKLPVIPVETSILLVGLVLSGAVTATFGLLYFAFNGEYFVRNRRAKFGLIPRVESDFMADEDNANDWPSVNILLALGLLVMAFAIFTDQHYNTFYDFVGIHLFLGCNKSSIPYFQQIKTMYYIAISALFWGYAATICACCMFYAVSLRIVSRIKHKEDLILANTISRDEFFRHNNDLHRYKDEILGKLRLWFAAHNIMFIILLAAIIYEWIIVLKNGKVNDTAHNYCMENMIMSQISGTLVICYKFGFPIISASLVTNRFAKFYLNVALSNKVKNIDAVELLALAEKTGFEVFYVIITPKLAAIIFISCFIGVLKFVAQLG